MNFISAYEYTQQLFHEFSPHKQFWYFVTKIVLTYCEKKLFYGWRKILSLRMKAENLHKF